MKEANVFRFIGIIFSGIGGLFVILGSVMFFFFREGLRSMLMLPLIFLFVGLIFWGLGIFFLKRIEKRNQIKQSLINRGYIIKAIVTEIKLDYSQRINNRHPYYLSCEFMDSTGTKHHFESERYLNSPDLALGSLIDVYVNPDNYDEYYVAL